MSRVQKICTIGPRDLILTIIFPLESHKYRGHLTVALMELPQDYHSCPPSTNRPAPTSTKTDTKEGVLLIFRVGQIYVTSCWVPQMDIVSNIPPLARQLCADFWGFISIFTLLLQKTIPAEVSWPGTMGPFLVHSIPGIIRTMPDVCGTFWSQPTTTCLWASQMYSKCGYRADVRESVGCLCIHGSDS